MDIAGVILALLGLAALLVGVRRERGRGVDVFGALGRLDRYDLMKMPLPFYAAALLGGLGSGFSYAVQGLGPAITAGMGTVVFTWLIWVWVLQSYRSIVDLAVTSQDAIPLVDRPAAAFDIPTSQAISFRPMRTALSLLAALAAGGIVFYVLAGSAGGWTQPLTALSLGYATAVLLVFGMRIRRALDAERDVRRILHKLPDVSTGELLLALQENPRSRVLLEMHGDRIADAGSHEQALIEYRAASVGRGARARLLEKTRSADALVSLGGESDPRRLKLEPYASKPTAIIAPLSIDSEHDELELLDPLSGMDTLLAWEEPNGSPVLVVVEPPLSGSEARELEPYVVLAPLVLAEGPIPHYLPAYRLSGKVRRALRARIEERGRRAFKRVELITTERVLARARVDSGTVFLPKSSSDLYDELRLTASIKARPVEGEVG